MSWTRNILARKSDVTQYLWSYQKFVYKCDTNSDWNIWGNYATYQFIQSKTQWHRRAFIAQGYRWLRNKYKLNKNWLFDLWRYIKIFAFRATIEIIFKKKCIHASYLYLYSLYIEKKLVSFGIAKRAF